MEYGQGLFEAMLGRASKLRCATKEEALRCFEEESKAMKEEYVLKEKYYAAVINTSGAEKYDSREGFVPLYGLKPTLLKEMTVDKTHQGQYIKLKVVSSVKIINAVEVMVEDEDGAC